MVALALGACSNATEDVANSENKGDAAFSFSIAMPAGTTSSRAIETAVGSDAENALKTANISIVYTGADASKATVSKSYTIDDFTPSTSGNYVVYTLKSTIEVAPGTAVAYATINGTTTPLDLSETKTVTYSNSLDALTGEIAKDNEFLMSGNSAALSLVSGKTVSGQIYVDRVAAKVEEITKDATFNVAATDNAPALTFTPASYTLLNLNNVTNVFVKDAPAAATSYFQAWTGYAGTNNYTYSTSKVKTFAANATTTTYILENGTTQPTKVVYAVNVKIGDNAAGTNIYRKGGKLYTYAQLEKDFDNIYSLSWKLQDTSDYTAWLAAGVEKYEGGVCYYVRDITTANVAKIVRNNWYKLQISSIAGIGDPVVDPEKPSAATLLQLSIYVNPWTVNANSFAL